MKARAIWPLLLAVTVVGGCVVVPKSGAPSGAEGGEAIASNEIGARRTEGPPGDPMLGAGIFLVAAPNLGDPNFSQTVVLLVEYGQDRALGLVVNTPTGVDLAELFPDSTRGAEMGDGSVFYGGPVERGRYSLLLLSDEERADTTEVIRGLRVGHTHALLDELTTATEGPRFRVYSGYTGWGPRQLDREVAAGGWVLRGALAEEVFHEEPGKLWRWLVRAGPARMAAILPR